MCFCNCAIVAHPVLENVIDTRGLVETRLLADDRLYRLCLHHTRRRAWRESPFGSTNRFDFFVKSHCEEPRF